MDEKNLFETSFGVVYGIFFIIEIVPDYIALDFIFPWELFLKTGGGIAVAVITALALNLGKDLYELKIKPKIFKTKKNASKKEDNSKAA